MSIQINGFYLNFLTILQARRQHSVFNRDLVGFRLWFLETIRLFLLVNALDLRDVVNGTLNPVIPLVSHVS